MCSYAHAYTHVHTYINIITHAFEYSAYSVAGTGLLSPLTITVGAWACAGATPTAVDGSIATCTLPAGQGGAWPLSVLNSAGFATIPSALTVSLPLALNAAVPGAVIPSGGFGGGTYLRLTGTGFGGDPTVLVVTASCASPHVSVSVAVVGAAFTTLDVLLPPIPPPSLPSPQPNTMIVTFSLTLTTTNGTVAKTSAFNYSAGLSPSLTSVKPNAGYAGTNITIAGRGFGASPTVLIGGVTCVVLASNDTRISELCSMCHL